MNSKVKHTYNMGVIGNCSYLAYINTFADIKWMCLPKFDSSFIFGSLIDNEKGGEFSIRLSDSDCETNQYYLQNTNILITELKGKDGHIRVIDCAPRFYHFGRSFKPLMLIRKIELIEGNPVIKVKCNPVGEYGELKPDIVQASNHIRYLNLNDQVRLTTDIPLSYVINEKSFLLNETKYLVLTYGEPLEAPLKTTAETFLENTIEYWRNWVKGTSIPNIFQEEIIRSALILKLHQYEDTGGIIAAGTTSLPEHEGSGRTWDYRYCWLRDTFYTLNAFNNIGHFVELEKYFNYIHNIILNEKGRINPLYNISGENAPLEKYLNLKGYRNNQPVRIGNNAVKQVQNDLYGQLIVSLLPLFIDKRLNYNKGKNSFEITKWVLDRISEIINEPDSGLWEYGKLIQQHCYTSLFHWAGGNAALKISNYIKNDDLKLKAQNIISQAAKNIELCYDKKRKVYTQAIGCSHLDASGLQLITMGYLDHNSDKAKYHLEAHEKELLNKDGLMFRYKRKDDLGKPQNTFLICSFWYAEALACVGRIDDANKLITKLITYSNHLGLFSEDADEHGGQWGNFPQTYSHVGLMNSIYRISIKQDKPLFI